MNVFKVGLPHIHRSIVTELTGWTDGVSWRSRILSKTIDHSYQDEASLKVSTIMQNEEGKAWSKTLPEGVLEALQTFEKRYQSLGLSCLWFVSRSLYAKELLLSSPFLTWLILRHAVRHQMPEGAVFGLFELKRTQVLELDGLPGEKRLLKFFEYLGQQGISVKEYDVLKKIILINGHKDLVQFKTINDQILRLLISSPELLQYRFMKNLTSFKNVKNILMMSGEVRVLGRYYEPDKYHQKLMKCKNVTALKSLHKTYLKRDWQLSQDLIKNEVFPFPPIQGNENVQYIRFKKELIQEGNDMNHCVADYFENIMKGRYFVFKILSPQRATLGLDLVNGKLQIDQVKLKNNQSASKSTLEMIKVWLS